MKLDLASGEVDVSPEIVILAGYTGRDQEAVRAHVRELAEQGVAPPPSVPAFFQVAPDLLTQDEVVRTPSDRSSGEAEVALFVEGTQIFVSVASDHTDRAAERLDVQLAKQCCNKVVGRQAWRLEDIEERWDRLTLRAWTGDDKLELYQESPLAALIEPRRLLALIPWRELPRSYCVFSGTVPAIGGMRIASEFRVSLSDAESETLLSLQYRTEVLGRLHVAVGGSDARDAAEATRIRLAAASLGVDSGPDHAALGQTLARLERVLLQ